jgi:hypothetical protein
LNRFARNVGAAIADVKRIHAAGAHLACVEEDIDPTGPFGAFILTVLLAVATLERDNAVAGFEAIKRKVKALTGRSTTNLELASLIAALNPVLRGWTNYYRHVSAKRTFGYLDYYLWWRAGVGFARSTRG